MGIKPYEDTQNGTVEMKEPFNNSIFMKNTTLLLCLLLALTAFSACKKDPVSPELLTELQVSPLEVMLHAGETKQLTVSWTPESASPEIRFACNKPEVAEVDEKGLISAISEGEAVITVKAGPLEKSVNVTVSAQENPIPADNQMPLLKFSGNNDNGDVEDPEITAHEEKIGRTVMPIQTESRENPLMGYGNKELSVITGAIYGLIDSYDGSPAIWAYSKEPIKECPETKRMLNEIGFSNLEFTDMGDYAFIVGVYDKDESIRVLMQPCEVPDVDGVTCLTFFKMKTSADVTVQNYLHAPLTDVKDFPSVAMLLTLDGEKIKEFEAGLGLRTYDPELTPGESPEFYFQTDSEKLDKTNFEWVFYRGNAESGAPFINTVLVCVQQEKDLEESEALKAWFKHNGFDSYTLQEDSLGKFVLATNSAEKVQGLMYVNLEFEFCYLELSSLNSSNTITITEARKHGLDLLDRLVRSGNHRLSQYFPELTRR